MRPNIVELHSDTTMEIICNLIFMERGVEIYMYIYIYIYIYIRSLGVGGSSSCYRPVEMSNFPSSVFNQSNCEW